MTYSQMLKRQVEILEAMLRVTTARLPVPSEWQDEYDDLTTQIALQNSLALQ